MKFSNYAIIDLILMYLARTKEIISEVCIFKNIKHINLLILNILYNWDRGKTFFL